MSLETVSTKRNRVYKRRSIMERFLERAPVTHWDSCVIWQGRLDKDGYGHLDREGPYALAHRVSYLLFVGPIPAGYWVDHLCRNHACVSPFHLEAVTPRENLIRGDTLTAHQILRTHCPQGHAYDNANTRVDVNGSRNCRRCGRDRARAKRREQ